MNNYALHFKLFIKIDEIKSTRDETKQEERLTLKEKEYKIKTTSVNWWFALRLKASLTGLGLKGPLSEFPLCTTFTH